MRSTNATLKSFLVAAAFLMPAAATAQEPRPDLEHEVRRVIAVWQARDAERPVALVDALVGLGAGVTPVLCRLLDGDRGGAPAAALASAVGRAGGYYRAPDSLNRLLETGAADERVAAVKALGELRMREACPYLVDATTGEDLAVASAAEAELLHERVPATWLAWAAAHALEREAGLARLARVLGRKRSDATHELLVRLARGSGDTARLAGLQGLYADCRAGDGEVALACLDDSTSPAVRRQACLVLGAAGHMPAARTLIDQLHGTDGGLASNAHWALRRITGLQLRADPELWERWWERVGSRQKGGSTGAEEHLDSEWDDEVDRASIPGYTPPASVRRAD